MNTLPNILFIMVDQQRYDCLGYRNLFPVQTPYIDQLATEGISFSNAFTAIPLCSPARQALLSGKRPEALGTLWNYDLGSKIPSLEPSEDTWVHELKRAGYITGYIGKWHVNPKHDPRKYGYEDYVPISAYEKLRNQKYPDVTYKNGWFGETNLVPVEDSRTHWLAKQANTMISKYVASGQPWHVRVDFPEPHLPCRPSGKFSTMYSPEEIPQWPNFAETFQNKPYIQKQQLVNWRIDQYTWEQWSPIVARYYGIISQIDDAVGLVLAALKTFGIEENTIVIYTSDHGDMCGAHRMMDKHYVLYDEIIRVPFIVKWPLKISPGQNSESFVYNVLDLYPTILEIIQSEMMDTCTGRSLYPILQGKVPDSWRTSIISTYNGQQFGLYSQRMIRNKEWKYIWNATDTDELYDLTNDPYELVNAIHIPKYQDIISALRKELYTTLLAEGDTLIDNEWLRDQLLNGRKL
ncbi:sulfatase-like hydrolase/transferase [Fodinisporobacter ferrooxydans]|uniref:Sulfatase-like hydrolase/transferase n=1 Tax=Fodinisporobacter ferrooxydans TaxID=2901836 RepID=A0ABY4CGI3_9BACL|nr:sulfatase-like hydrolase/transferase [Alicyclobacillaceae bacterium MYW30-H2]